MTRTSTGIAASAAARMSLTALAIVVGFAAHAATDDASGAGKERPARPDFATLDTNSDGQLSKDELQAHAKTRFDARDRNGDGKLTAEELTFEANKRMERRAAKMIKRMDADSDGAITFEEMSAKQGRRGKMFERMDADSNGSLSAEEFAKLEQRGGKRHGGHGMGKGHHKGKDGHGRGVQSE